jgi:hypothetical protein
MKEGQAESGATIAADMQALARIEQRFAGTEGERRMLDAVRSRLPEGVKSRNEGFVGRPSPLLVWGVHGVVALVGGVLGIWYPRVGAAICLLTVGSLIGEGTGRFALSSWWLGAVPSYNLVVPSTGPASLGTIVLVTPLDVPARRMWRPRWMRRPLQGVLVSSSAIAVLLVLRALAEPWGIPLLTIYSLSLLVMAATSALVLISRREPQQVSSDAGGVAVALELLRRLQEEPLPGVAVWTVFSGCGRAHQDGVESFLRLRGQRLDGPVLVLSVREAARSPLQAVVTEGPLWPQHHRPTGPALVERLRWAGVRVPEIDSPEPSDARAAMLLGYRALAFNGGQADPSAAGARRAVDIVLAVMRWYAQDLARLEHARPALQDLAARTELLDE